MAPPTGEYDQEILGELIAINGGIVALLEELRALREILEAR